MGAFGTSLYSGDFALDLRSTIAVLARLPFDGDRIFSVIRDMEPGAADNPADADHTTFWLVLADQLHRRGIAAEAVRSRALSLIDSGSDTETMRKLGMKESDLRKRAIGLSELRARLVSGSVPPRRTTLRKPQRLLMNVGDVYAYPTAHGSAYNPYVGPNAKRRRPWTPDA